VRSIRIAFIASTFGVGGAERVMADVISRLDARYEPRLYFLREAGTVGRELVAAGTRAMERFERFRGDPLAAYRLGQELRRWRPDVVFCMDHHNAMLAGRLAGLMSGAKALVVASHSTGLFGRAGSFRASDRWLVDFTDRFVALSETHARYMIEREGISAGRIRVIENGVDTSRYRAGDAAAEVRSRLGVAPDEDVVLMVAALRPEKAHEALVRATGQLVRRGRRLRVLLAGEGPQRGALERQIAGERLEGTVELLGVRHDVHRLLEAADVLVLPSHPVVETLPLCVLEAMAAGVPVVASGVGSVPEVVRDGETGILIAPGDAGELAAGIERVLRNGDEARAMTLRARTLVEERYSAERMTSGYERLFDELAA
jgi:glycosyltransferase involved in cell wall biosynthesis